MDKKLIVILIGLSSISCSHFPLRKYFHFSSAKTWKDAQLYCRETHTDLATFESIEEVNQFNPPATISGFLWNGLHDDPTSWRGTLGNDTNSWRWSTTGQEIRSEYHNWASGEPNYSDGKELCVLMTNDSQWKDAQCSGAMGYICYTDIGQNQKTYVFISESRTWNQAQAYCREHHTDLALITSAEENAMAKSVTTNIGWIGLYRIPWAWSDMTPLQFTNWEAGQPNNYGHQYCGLTAVGTHLWGDANCGSEIGFICHEVRKSKIRVKILMKSTNDLADPVLHEEILQKISAAFTNQKWTNVKLQWTTQPRKTEETFP